MEFIKLAISNFILNSFTLITWHNIFNKKINFKDMKIYIAVLILTIISILGVSFENKLYRILILMFVFTVFINFIFKENLTKSIIGTLFYELIIMISETIYIFILTLILKLNSQVAIKYYSDTLLANTLIGVFAVLISKTKVTNKLFNVVTNLFKGTKKLQLVFICIVAILSIIVFPFTVYYEIDFIYLIVLYFSLDLLFCFIIFYSLITKNKYDKISNKYNIALNSLKDYEEMMSKYRIMNHENKNLLLTIRAMSLSSGNEIPKYIDSIMKNKNNDDEKLLFKMNVIPSGGLRATIYSEILKIQNQKIKYTLNIDKQIKTVDLINLDTNEIIDLCKIIGVFIDNAIDAVRKKSKKYIDISLFLIDDKLNIKITNNYSGKINLDRLSKPGYTTKKQKDGHGYGLTLVKNIADNNENIKIKTEAAKEFFSQTLIIKYNKQ